MGLTETEQRILDSIHVASENDPNRPEFPVDDPKFPATPTHKLEVPGFSNVWLKDESYNPTGTHKDRMAWEIVVTYREMLLAKQRGQLEGPLPHMSLISSGSAAYAVQKQLQKYGLPHLKVLIDPKLDHQVITSLEDVGCEIFRTDLSKKALQWDEILALTHNPDGFDITSAEALDPTTRFYDWLSYEIINNNPEWCFVPFGTGNLFENLLNINKKEVSSGEHDPRFQADVDVLRRCHFIGVTTNDPYSRAEKLYSPHLPFVHFDEQWIKLYRYSGFCGKNSDVKLLKERYLDEALRIIHENGFQAEPSGAAGLAMLLQMREHVPSDAKVLVVSTGKTKY